MTQADALNIMKMGHNVFLTGGAGSGKTYVLNAFIKYLYDHDIDMAITASTGIAATHIGGMTIHAWSGMGIRETLTDWDIEMLEEKKYLYDRYEKVKVLIIDEISMLSGPFLDTLDRLCRAFKRKPDAPFGGIQIVLCGDLFQLPPVTKRDEQVRRVIDSNAWRTMGLVMCYIMEQHRQEDDAFLDILNAIRKNDVQDYHLETLEERIREFDPEEFASITKLFTHNADVDAINSQALEAISEEEFVYHMTSKGKDNLIESLKKSCLAPEVLKLKIGAEVMFVKNSQENGYVNGTRGTVIDINAMNMPVVQTLEGKEINVDTETWAIDDNGKILASITQLPLRHAWAITVHKSQGMSLDSAVIDLSNSFAYGMGYVALSRVRSLAGLHLVGFSAQALAVDPQILKMDSELQNASQRAEARLVQLSDSELKMLHDDFVTRSGGTLEVKKSKKGKASNRVTNQKTHETTYDMIKSGKTINDVIHERELTAGTVIDHLDKAKQLGKDVNFKHIKPGSEDMEVIAEAFRTLRERGEPLEEIKLTPVKKYLDAAGYVFGFDTLKLARLFLDGEL